MLNKQSDPLKSRFSESAKKFVKILILVPFSWIPLRLNQAFIKILNQSIGFGFDSGLRNEVFQFSRVIQKYKVENPVVLDVGANIGNWSKEFNLQFENCVIHAFEPSKKTYLKLVESTKEYPNTHVYNLGLGQADNFQNLYYDVEESGMASLSKRNLKHLNVEFEEFEQVKVVRLDTFLQEKSIKPDFMKIDVEGHELDVLQGLGAFIKDLKVIQFEFGGTDIDSRTYFQDFWNFFEGTHFRLYRLTPKGKIRVDTYREADEIFSFTTYFAIAESKQR